MLEFVTLSDLELHDGNPIIEQHKLRFAAITERQGWDVPFYEGMEFDEYDNPAAKYLVYRGEDGRALGSSRLYPTTLPYMLEKSFSNFVTNIDIPKQENVWEGSRFCIEKTLPPEERRLIAQSIIIGYLEVGLHFGIDAIVGLMYPAYWRHLFIQNGWDLDFIGKTIMLNDGYKARAGWLPISHAVLENVREKTKIYEPILNLGGTIAGKEKRAA